ncbi:MAG: hypothetical protein AAGJ18_19005, partial [Bacteroidota bacterium]
MKRTSGKNWTLNTQTSDVNPYLDIFIGKKDAKEAKIGKIRNTGRITQFFPYFSNDSKADFNFNKDEMLAIN